MTEGSWGYKDNFPDMGSVLHGDMRAYAARYSLLMASTMDSSQSLGVSREYWCDFVGPLAADQGNGTMCDDGATTQSGDAIYYPCYVEMSTNPQDTYAGYAYGQVMDWLSGGAIAHSCTAVTLNRVHGCQDMNGSLWMYPIEEAGYSSANAIAVWLWDDSSTNVTCPGTTGCPSLSSYSDYRTLKGQTVPITQNTTITFTQEPILLEQ